MQMVTSLGLIQPGVLPFGIHSGPSAMQKCVNAVFQVLMKTKEFQAFLDDCAVCSGKAGQLANPCDPACMPARAAFWDHLDLIARMLDLAEDAGLKFKLTKCAFAQLNITVLGFLCCQGCRSLDPDKVAQCRVWPRPREPGDPDRFVGFCSFLRAHCAATFANASKALRDLGKVKLEKARTWKAWRELLDGRPEAEDVLGKGEERGHIPVVVWKDGIESMQLTRDTPLRSGNLPWSWTHEESFRELQRLVVRAVDLYVPDTDGALTGEYPFKVWPDACGYGVGAGCFQLQRLKNSEQLTDVLVNKEYLATGAVAARARKGATKNALPESDQGGAKSVPLKILTAAEFAGANECEIVLVLFSPSDSGTRILCSSGEVTGQYRLPHGNASPVAAVTRALNVAQEVSGAQIQEQELVLVGRKAKMICYLVVVTRKDQSKAKGTTWTWLAWQAVNTNLQGEEQEWSVSAWRMLAEEGMAETPEEWVLVPIAFWSRALSGAQLGWSTWEQELYAVRECTWAWSTWIAGTYVQLFPDHLNNLVVSSGETLRQPHKITRWLEDIEARIKALWSFMPGIVNKAGDGCSRDVPERDSLRQMQDDGPLPPGRKDQPSTLADVFERAHARQELRDTTLRGQPWAPGRYNPAALVEQKTMRVFTWPRRNDLGMRVVDCVLVLSIGTDRQISADLPHFATGEVVCKASVKLLPMFEPEELGRWYVPNENIEGSVPLLKKMRLQIFDSALLVLRGLYQIGAEGALVQGEGIVPFLVILHGPMRRAAYQARRVSPVELEQLEGAFLRLSFLFLQNPCSYPPYHGLRTVLKALRPADATLELQIPAHMQVFLLRLEGDPYVGDTDRIAQCIKGHAQMMALPSSPTESAIDANWRLDWCPNARDILYAGEPVAYCESVPRMKYLVSAQSLGAAVVEPSVLRDGVALRRFAAALECNTYNGVFVRDTTEGSDDRAAILLRSAAIGDVAMCYVARDAVPDDELGRSTAEVHFYHSEDEGELPLAVHTRGKQLKKMVELATKEAEEQTWPLEVAFLRSMRMLKVETSQTVSQNEQGSSSSAVPASAEEGEVKHDNEVRTLVTNWKPALYCLERCQEHRPHERGERCLKQEIFEKLMKIRSGPVMYRELTMGVGCNTTKTVLPGEFLIHHCVQGGKERLQRLKVEVQPAIRVAHLSGFTKKATKPLHGDLPGVLWVDLYHGDGTENEPLSGVPPEVYSDTMGAHGEDEVEGMRNLIELMDHVVNTKGVVFLTLPAGAGVLLAIPLSAWVMEPYINTQRYDVCRYSRDGKYRDPTQAPPREALGEGQVEQCNQDQQVCLVDLPKWRQLQKGAAIRIDLKVKEELEQGRRQVFAELVDLLEPLMPRGWHLVCGTLRKFPKRLRRVDVELYPSFMDGDLLLNIRRLHIVRVGEDVRISSLESYMDLPSQNMNMSYPKFPRVAWSVTLFGLILIRGQLKPRPRGEMQCEQVVMLGAERTDPESTTELAKMLPLTTQEPGAPHSPLRRALAKAQRESPALLVLIKTLEGKKAKEVAVDLTGYRKAKQQANEHALAPDGVLLQTGVPGTVAGSPVIPDVAVGNALPECCPTTAWTWRQFYLNLAHQDMPGGHNGPEAMEAGLLGVGHWAGLPQDVRKWVQSCRICASRNVFPKVVSTLKSMQALRPGTTLVWDLVFVEPKGRQGQIGACTVICVYTKHVWIEPIFSKSAISCAWAILAVVLRVGVSVRKLLSDREPAFRDRVMIEFTALLNTRQGFSLAYAPQGHGVIERVNSEVHKIVGKAIESLSELEPKDWPMLLPLVAAKWNEKDLGDGITPFSLLHGYFSSSTMSTTLEAIGSIPPALPLTTWVKGIQAANKLLSRTYDENKATQRAIEALQRVGQVYPHDFKPGDQVLIHRFGPLKMHVMGGRGSGPWIIETVTKDGKAVTVKDAFTNQSLVDRLTGLPDKIATSRLMRLEAPMGAVQTGVEVEETRVGDVVAWKSEVEIRLLRVKAITLKVSVTGTVLVVPTKERHGPWTRRPWEPIRGQQDQVVQWRDLLMRVKLQPEGTLSRPSVDLLLNKLNMRQ
jgi:hypothetical protein